jgi:DNA recombination protein RmuC
MDEIGLDQWRQLWNQGSVWVLSSWGQMLSHPAAPMIVALAFGVFGVLLFAGLIWLVGRAMAPRPHDASQDALAAEIRAARALMTSEIAELKGRIAAMSEIGEARSSELTQALAARLDRVSDRLGEGMQSIQERVNVRLVEQGLRTTDSLGKLFERLAVIDRAGASLSELTQHVVTLKDVLGNKQARGAFGQVRMEAIIEDGLPRSLYEFQPTLSNGKRPDCLIRLPSAATALVVDAKFPLEGFEALRLARGPEVTAMATLRIREAITRHIDDIASKYLIAGETQDMALMFVPSESIMGELSERFPELIQRAHRARVVIVSPNMLMLAIQTIQAVVKDVQMREQASLIQQEVALMVGDVTRLTERVRDLDKHFTLAAKDVEKILTTASRITERGARIEQVDVQLPLAVAAE